MNHKEKRLADSGTLNPNPEEVTDPLFKGHVFFDAQDLIQVKYEMLRRVEASAFHHRLSGEHLNTDTTDLGLFLLVS